MSELSRQYYYRIDDPTLKGLHLSLNSLARVENPTWARGDQHKIGLIPCRANPSAQFPPLVAVDQSEIDSVRIAIGDPDKEPTAGSFVLQVTNTSSSNSVFTGAIAYNADATAFQNAINAVVGAVFLLSVTATKSGTDYIITAGAGDLNFSITESSEDLTPECEVTVKKLRDATSDVRSVWRVRVAQKGIAYAEPVTAYPTLAATITADSIQTGTATKPAIQRIELDPAPYDGTALWQYSESEVVSIVAKATDDTAAEDVEVVTVSDVSGSLSGKYFDLYDASGVVRVWIDIDNTGSPPNAGGGRLLEVDVATGASAASVAFAIKTAVDADASFIAIADQDHVRIFDSYTGARTAPSAGTSGFTVTRNVAGSWGSLHQKYLKLYDQNGSVGVWFDVSGEDIAPAGASACLRKIRVPLDPEAGAQADVAAAIKTAIDADANFVATNSGEVVTVTASTAGSRTAAVDVDSGCAVSVTTKGASCAFSLPYNARAEDIESGLDSLFDVRILNNGLYELEGITNGARASVSIGTSKLKTPQGVQGDLSFETLCAQEEFAASSGDKVTTLGIEATISGKPRMCVSTQTTVIRDNITTV